MNGALSLEEALILAAYALGMVGGQLLFKLAAMRSAAMDGPLAQVMSLMLSGPFILAVALYGGLSLLWVWLLSFIPLSRAYPFVAIAVALTPIFGGLFFGEALSVRFLFGLVFIVFGLFLANG